MTAKQKYTKQNLIRLRDQLLAAASTTSVSLHVIYSGDSWHTITISALIPDRMSDLAKGPVGQDYH